mmetsp:Transcript_36920/g.57235  ORF Transcript_36920/g.57235 Transcript_36920/m.57235 type:complete len:366 (+) Transcript_36920:127-1224(+)
MSFDDEWEEWDGKTPFWHHCVAGSLAGVAEHTLVYPLDTVRTHLQVCAACQVNPTSAASKQMMGSTKKMSVLQKAATNGASRGVHNLGMWQTMRQLMSQPIAMEGTGTATATKLVRTQAGGFTRLWRGVQTIMVGCIPAHALYFSTYEMVKAATLDKNGQVTTYGSVMAGAAAVVSHDIILGPLDTIKQRLQLGHYRGLSHAVSTMVANEGFVSLYRSFPVTLASNIPYGMVMVGTNEFCKQQWSEGGELTLGVTLAASSLAGLIASATTTPLDRIKTMLQTQQLSPACSVSAVPPENCPLTKGNASVAPIAANWQQAALRIYTTEGAVGFFRGMTPRILSHTPAVAISWTTYETAKQYLQRLEL